MNLAAMVKGSVSIRLVDFLYGSEMKPLDKGLAAWESAPGRSGWGCVVKYWNKVAVTADVIVCNASFDTGTKDDPCQGTPLVFISCRDPPIKGG
jgi:hypothetical protein